MGGKKFVSANASRKPAFAYYDIENQTVVIMYKDPYSFECIDAQSFERYLLSSTSELMYTVDDVDEGGNHIEIYGTFSFEEYVEFTKPSELAHMADRYLTALKRPLRQAS
jgi:hypothetical protein